MPPRTGESAIVKVSVFGLGYVGAVSAACLANDDHLVVGVDTSEAKVGLINEGRTPIIEQGVEELIGTAVRNGRLWATADAAEAVLDRKSVV